MSSPTTLAIDIGGTGLKASVLDAMGGNLSNLEPLDEARARYADLAQAARRLGYPLGAELETRFGKPVRLANDADMHGLAVIAGEGLELVVTLGTGLGTALFYNGTPTPHLELALVPYEEDDTFLAGASGCRDVRRIAPVRSPVRGRWQRTKAHC